MSEQTPAQPRPVEGQSFLIGPTLYLRGVELKDGKAVTRWRPSPFPIPVDLAKEQLKKKVPQAYDPDTHRLVACRRADDVAVGSVEYSNDDPLTSWLNLYADPARGEQAAEIKAEILGIVVPWLVGERECMTVWCETADGEPAVARAAGDLGMRRAYRLREAVWQDGGRRDLICYEALNPAWVRKLGEPALAEEGAVERETRQPATRVWAGRTGEPPRNAFVVGDRLYLRPIEEADSKEMARWSARETETFHDNGRVLRSPISEARWNRKHMENEPPKWIRFAIVAKEGNVLIGANGILDVDWIAKTGETESDIVRPDYRGAGYGTEAKHLLLEYAFERLGLHMVKSYAWEFNTRSCGALRKQGYRDAGCVVWSGIKNGEFVGDRAFDLLASEWRAART